MRKLIVSNFQTLDGYYESTNLSTQTWEGSGNILAVYQPILREAAQG